MPPPPSTTSPTRQRLVETAANLFYREGFHTVGIDAILDRVGVTKTTFYNHFDSKEDLVLEAMRYEDTWWRDTFRQLLRKNGGDTPRGQLAAVFDALDFLFTKGDYNGCFFINVAVQFPQPHDPAHQAAAAHKRAMEDIIREIAGYAHADDPQALAQELSLLLEGAYVTLQITQNKDTLNIARRIGHDLIKRRLPAPAPRDGERAGERG